VPQGGLPETFPEFHTQDDYAMPRPRKPRTAKPVTQDDPAPVPPIPPQDGECCGNGCDPCVHDRYDTALQRYEAALLAWRKRNESSSPRG
jgi:hypothetical protein